MAVSEHRKDGRFSGAGVLPPDEVIFGRSGAMISIRQKVQKVLGTDVPILIEGENGTGKGLLAHYRIIHRCAYIKAGLRGNGAPRNTLPG